MGNHVVPEEIYNIATELFNHANDLNQYSMARITKRVSNVLKNSLKRHHVCQELLYLTSYQHEVQLKQQQLLELGKQKKLAASITMQR